MDAIFSVFHKDYYIPRHPMIFPIAVGENKETILCHVNKKIYRDGVGDHISDLNPHFGEMTAMYWIWKNFPQEPHEIAGLLHYRRYLDAKGLGAYLMTALCRLIPHFLEAKIRNCVLLSLNPENHILSSRGG